MKKLPMVLMDAVHGCESHNRQFFIEKGAALTGRSPKALSNIALRLLRDREKCTQMAGNLGNFSKVNTADDLLLHIVTTCKEQG